MNCNKKVENKVSDDDELTVDDEYCPYDRVEVWCSHKDLLEIYKEQNVRLAYVKAVAYEGRCLTDFNITPDDIEEQKEFIKDMLLTNLKKQILFMNYCLRWLTKIAKPDNWDMYNHDYYEILDERRHLIRIWYDIDAHGYMTFLSIIPETMEFEYWDPVQRVEERHK